MTVGEPPARVKVLHRGLVQGARQRLVVGLEPGETPFKNTHAPAVPGGRR
jgi:hypothetical protein